jgi:hypothetical protein
MQLRSLHQLDRCNVLAGRAVEDANFWPIVEVRYRAHMLHRGAALGQAGALLGSGFDTINLTKPGRAGLVPGIGPAETVQPPGAGERSPGLPTTANLQICSCLPPDHPAVAYLPAAAWRVSVTVVTAAGRALSNS